MREEYNPMMTEKGTIDRAIEIEKRMVWIVERIAYIDERLGYVNAFGFRWTKWVSECEELEAELYDLQKEYRG